MKKAGTEMVPAFFIYYSYYSTPDIRKPSD